ncbi:MAG TPA: TonB-dependent receptor [Bacteroidia bacterium]|jgi:hypothetical protein|nr:TonB-dependent receptor [Bacteroidia bacterium]
MRILFCTILALVFSNIKLHSQTIEGRIVDSTQSPISFATIALLNKSDSTIVKGVITNEKGFYSFSNVKQGVYILKINTIGFNDAFSSIIQIDSATNFRMPDMQLISEGVSLNEISVTSIKKTIEFKNGNIIVNVENSPLAKGNTVYDLLSKLPGVSIDNNVIQLNGKTGVIIMLDGRVQQLTNIQIFNMLKSMNAELVEKIELLKNPPVKYDAAGTSGMINIKTKKTKTIGFNGSAYTSSSQGFYARSMSGLSLNYKSSKIALFSNLDYNYGDYQSKEKFNKKFSTDTSATELNAVNTINDVEKSLTYKIGADWFVNKKNILGFKIDGGPGSFNSTGYGTTKVLQYNNLGFDHLDASTYIPDKWIVNNYNINAEHHFDTIGTVLNFTSDYTRLSEKYASGIQNHFLDAGNREALSPNIYRSSNMSATTIFASKLDFTKIINPTSSFETGAKTSFINTSNNYLFERKDNSSGNYFQDTTLTNNYIYIEQTYAAYLNYIKSFKKINMQLGLRAENTNLTGRNTVKEFEIKRSYYNLFPNISLGYAISKNNSLQLNLNRRIDRPQYNDLNPFRFYRDQYSYYEGNPFLQPHYSNNIEITHSYKQLITNSFTYTRIDNVMLNYTRQNDSSKVTTETIKNMKLNNYYAYSFSIQHTLKPWWELSVNGTLSYIEFIGDVDGAPFKTASFYYSPRLTNTLIVQKNTKLEIIAFYNSGKNNGLTQVKSRWMASLAIKRTFFKGKLDGSIGINDIFYSSYFRTGVNFNNQNWNFYVTQDTRRLVVSLNYNFGNTKVVARETQSNEQEKSRLNH